MSKISVFKDLKELTTSSCVKCKEMYYSPSPKMIYSRRTDMYCCECCNLQQENLSCIDFNYYEIITYLLYKTDTPKKVIKVFISKILKIKNQDIIYNDEFINDLYLDLKNNEYDDITEYKLFKINK
jgi:hypothetical protein